MRGPKIRQFGLFTAEQCSSKVEQRLWQILTHFRQSTPTSEGSCEPPSGRIFVPFSPKILEYAQLLGNLGGNPFLRPPRRGVLNASAKWLLSIEPI